MREQEAEPVEGKQRPLDACNARPAIVSTNQTAGLVDATNAAKAKGLRLSTPAILRERVATDLTVGPWQLDYVAHDQNGIRKSNARK